MARVNEDSQFYLPPTRTTRTILAFTPQPHRTSTRTHFPPPEGRRLSWPLWLVTNRGGLPACRRSPIPVGLLTGPDVE